VICINLCIQDSGWEQVNLEIASSRKFKWLRERMVGSSLHTTLLNQIKNFVLTDEVDVNSLRGCLGRQVPS
jgi:E3 ubiquitin-protein ligase HERC2